MADRDEKKRKKREKKENRLGRNIQRKVRHRFFVKQKMERKPTPRM
jgi:hypothetical protein